MYKLIIEDDEGKTTPVPIIRDEITIGRKEGNTIRLTERNVSRRHARIIRQNSALYVEDLQSYNGVKVNNERIQGKVPLGDGDVIVIGDYRLSIKQDKAEAKPPAAAAQAPQAAAASNAPTVANPALQASAAPTVQAANVPPPAAQAAKSPEKPARLIVVSSNFARQEFPLEKAAMVIGRTDDNDIVLNHRSISRHHAKIVREGDHFHVVDLQSANGVRVNGEDYNKVELRKGDQIDLGHVRLIFVPPGQDIDIRDKIVDLDGGRSPAMTIGMVVLLLAIVGGGIYWFLNRGPSVDPESEAAKTLIDVESDIQAKRWNDAVD
ncbi:MAG: FHA domain-containing protein, partial [Elusimicrobia bacterium]